MDMYIIHPMHNLKFLETIIIRPNVHLAMLACGVFILISGATLKLNERNESVLSFYKRRLTKILIPNAVKQGIFEELIAKGYTYQKIYPDFEGVAKEANYQMWRDYNNRIKV